METTNYTVKHSKRQPVTLINPYHGQDRVVSYKIVKMVTIKIGRNKYNAGESWGLRYGTIRLNGETRLVSCHLMSNGNWSQWELI